MSSESPCGISMFLLLKPIAGDRDIDGCRSRVATESGRNFRGHGMRFVDSDRPTCPAVTMSCDPLASSLPLPGLGGRITRPSVRRRTTTSKFSNKICCVVDRRARWLGHQRDLC